MHIPLPSETPTERVTYHDLITAARERGDFRRYLEAYRAESERLSRLKGVSLALTLREIAGY